MLPLILLAGALALACTDPAQEHIDRGRKLFQNGDLEGAAAAFEKATQANPDSAVAWNNLGNVSARQGRNERAMELYRRAIEADADRLEPHYNLANALMDAQRTDEAVEEYERALQIDPNRPQVQYNLAYALYRLNRFDKSWEALQHAAELGADAETVAQLDAAIRVYFDPGQELATDRSGAEPH